MYKLVIAEKPSVAQSIAKVIGATNREDGFLEGNGYLVSWCVGHLVELAPPDLYEERYSKWIYKDLPIIPDDWKYQVSENTKKQYAVLKKLMNRDDVKGLVAATDSGREGELIFRLVYHQCGCRKPFERLWISSMEDSAIVEGFAGLRAGTEYDALYEAALCRERADWIVGMNATRLFSVLYGQTLNVGRVMTPTLAMMVMRESEIAAFQPEPVYTVSINVSGVEAVSEKYKDKVTADTLLASCREAGKTVVSKNNVAEKKEKPPLLYDLTNLQRDANRILGYTAQQTLDYTQSLYEKKLVTYPRTDSRYLTEDMSLGIENLANMIREKFGFVKALTVNKEQVINNKKVSDHHAIIPTINIADVVFGELPAGEQKVLSLISARFLSALGNSRKVEESTIEFRCGGAIFRVKSKAVRDEGWKEIQNWIMGKNSENEQDEKLINKELLAIFTEGRELPVQNCEMKEGKTSPKHHFTEDTLLNAMEHASADEMDGVWLHIQDEHHKKMKKQEMKVFTMYEGWDAEQEKQKRSTLVGKTILAGMENSTEFHEKREACIRQKYNADEIGQRILNGDGGSWIKEPYDSEAIFQLDRYHIYQEIIKKISSKEAQKAIRELFDEEKSEEMLEYIKIYATSVASPDAEDKTSSKAMELYQYLSNNKEGLLPYNKRGIAIPESKEGLLYKGMGIQETQNCTVITLRMKHRRMRWSVSGANNLAKALYRKENRELIETIDRYTDGLVFTMQMQEIVETLSAAKAPKKDGKGNPYADRFNHHMPLLDAMQTASRKAFKRAFGY